MTTSLPAGIITNSDSIAGDIEKVDAVRVEDVQRLWKGSCWMDPCARGRG